LSQKCLSSINLSLESDAIYFGDKFAHAHTHAQTQPCTINTIDYIIIEKKQTKLGNLHNIHDIHLRRQCVDVLLPESTISISPKRTPKMTSRDVTSQRSYLPFLVTVFPMILE
jgi:hypothetical protein